jgi:uncharacterized membrane protein
MKSLRFAIERLAIKRRMMGFGLRQGIEPNRRCSDRAPTAKASAAAVLCGVGWTWALTLLAAREHLTADYEVIPHPIPLWGNLGLPGPILLLALGVGLGVAIACGHAVRTAGQFWTPPIRWLMCSWLIPVLDLLRATGVPIPVTFLEPVLVAGVTGAAVGTMTVLLHIATSQRRVWPAIPWAALVWLLAVLCCAWWYYEGQQAYNDYRLGYNDFGHFGFRVASTWEGRGFLMETPSLPAFWDHFNPGLTLLAPLWGIWPDPRLFILIQAVCLAVPAPLVYAIARRMGAGEGTSACWTAAYLTFPAVGQLNLNCTYGWHPVSLAMPLIFLTIWALLRRWRTLALVAAVFACSFQEDVIVVFCLFALSLAILTRFCRSRRASQSSVCGSLPSDALPCWAWIVVAVTLAATFVVIFEIAPMSKYQSNRFSSLGGTAKEILVSPFLRPTVFWGTIFRPRCGFYLLCLLIPLGLRSLLAGWPTLLATALPLGVLLAWSHVAATSIAFQYATALIPILFLAAMLGAVRQAERFPSADETAAAASRSQRLWRAASTALAASMTASTFFGAMPWSSPTLSDIIGLTYYRPGVAEDRLVGSPGNTLLNETVAKVGEREAAVLATGRIAAHLLAVRRLDTVGQAVVRWKAFQDEIGPGRSPIELFDWVVLDTEERFYQTPKELRFVIDAAKRARYRLTESDRGILIFARP